MNIYFKVKPLNVEMRRLFHLRWMNTPVVPPPSPDWIQIVTILRELHYNGIPAAMTAQEILKENAIVELSKRDPHAFSALYEKYFDRIYYFILRQTDDEETAGDLCSQTFVNVLHHLKSYQFRGLPFSAWLYKIASNEVNKYYRKKKGTKIFSIEETKVRELVERSDRDGQDWDEDIIRQLLVYLKDLPTDMLQVLELRFFEDKDFKEIAFILDMTESGAKMRTYRALDKLRKHFNIKVKYDE